MLYQKIANCPYLVLTRGQNMIISVGMKKDIHPENYRMVIFKDTSNGEMVLAGSTVATEKTGKFTDGQEYPLYEVEISSSSHPFYTGDKSRLLDTAGRAERFRKRAEKAGAKKTKKVRTNKEEEATTAEA